MSYSEQSQKLLSINSINLNSIYPEIEVDPKRYEKDHSDLIIQGKKISFGIDSFEDYKMWYEDYFIQLADKLYQKKYLIIFI